MTDILGYLSNILLAAAIAYGLFTLISRKNLESGAFRITGIVVGALGGLLTLWGTFAVTKIGETAAGIVIAIVGSALIFIGANQLFDLAPGRWVWFSTLLGAGAAGGVFAVLWGNQVLESPVLYTLLAVAIGGVAGYLLGTVEAPMSRLGIGVVGGGLAGLIGFLALRAPNINASGQVVIDVVDDRQLLPVIPQLQYGSLVGWTVGVAVVGLVIWQLMGRSKSIARVLARWGTLGFFIGAWLIPDIGFGGRSDAFVATVILGLGLGAVAGLTPYPSRARRVSIEDGSRSYIFLAPALGFIGVTLVIPTIRTIILSFHDSRGDKLVGWSNYSTIFQDPNVLKLSGWTNIFTSRMFIWGAILAGVGVLASVIAGRRIGDKARFSPGTLTPISLGGFLIVFAVFAAIRGTFSNNLWWVFTVTVVATAAGLAIAVLADRAKYESVAKSMIFMPMAISFVGAGVIWRFMYLPRDPSQPQTGVLNTAWVALGRLSNNPGPRNVVVGILVLLGLLLLYLAYRAWNSAERTIAIGSAVTALPLLWLAWKFVDGLGGFGYGTSGELVPETILFVQESPFNNVWIMLVLIWIQTGFTMVIFSAAIKAVPSELVEAAKVDGATESQTFWRVVLPQIMPTVGVVVTTLIVLVMKVFDMVKVMTNGNFDTNVVANEMWSRAFTQLNFGLGSALAAVLFVAVLPILYINIRRMQKEAATR